MGGECSHHCAIPAPLARTRRGKSQRPIGQRTIAGNSGQTRASEWDGKERSRQGIKADLVRGEAGWQHWDLPRLVLALNKWRDINTV